MTYSKEIDLAAQNQRVKDINFLAPNNFEFFIDNKTYPNASFLVTDVDFPAFTIGAAEVASSMRVAPFHADKVTYDRLSVTFIVDENMINYLEIHDWMLAQVTYNDKYPEDSKRRDIKLIINSSHNNKVQTVTFIDAFPTDMSPISFTSRINDIDYVNVNVQFAFSYFTFE